MESHSLGYIKDLLTKEGMDVHIVTSTKDLPFKHLQLSLGNDSNGRPIIAYIFLDKRYKGEHSQKKQPLLLQFLLVFPFHFADEMVSEIGRYLLVINKSLAFPGFGLSEPDRSIYYKYTLSFPDGNIVSSFLIDFIGSIWLIYDAFSQKIEEVAIGVKNLAEIVTA